MGFDVVSVAAITVIAYLIGLAAKNIPYVEDKWIPVICGASGGILGIIGFLTKMADFPATDGITAIAVGVVSGLAAVGINQITKQLNK